MEWHKITITTTLEGLDTLSGVLLGLGITGLEINDPKDFLEFVNTATPSWDYLEDGLMSIAESTPSVSCYLPENQQGQDMLRLIESELSRLKTEVEVDLGALSLSMENLREEDWATSWKQYFKPTPVGERLLIRPSWETLEGIDTTGRAILSIDPSASFGTGTHDTTRLCLTLLETLVKGGEQVLDMGCGSGILGIAAMLLGAKGVLSVDIDENAVRIAGENFKENGFSDERVQFLCGNALSSEAFVETLSKRRYPLVVANIVADVIIGLLPVFGLLLQEGGRLLLSGIIEEREGDVRAALTAAGYTIETDRRSGGWVALVARTN